MDGSGLAGATVTLAGTASASAVTDANGTYSFAQLANGSYTLTAAKTGYIVTPSSISVTVDNADLPEQNFTALSASMTIAAGYFHSLALKGDGTVWVWGYNWSGQLGDGTTTDRSTPVQVSGLSG
jgi:inhibitor of cysteine peptidase